MLKRRFPHYKIVMILLKFNSLVFFCIWNQSMIANIPQQPAVSNFNIPIPVSPSINLSMPNSPRKIETKRSVVGSFNSTVLINENLDSSAASSFSFKYIIFSSGKYFWFFINYISTFCCSILRLHLLIEIYLATSWLT